MELLVPLLFYMRDIVLPWQTTLIIDHYPVALDCATSQVPENYISPFWKFLRLSEAHVWTEVPIMKYIEISDRILSPFWDTIYCDWIELRFNFFDKLISMGPMFLQYWMCHISNMIFINYFLPDCIAYFFAMCINGNRSWCCDIIVLNGTIIESTHLG